MKEKKYTMIDLFSAPGGLTLGFEEAGFESLVGMDIDEKGMRTYRTNFPHAEILSGEEGDIRDPAIRQRLKEIVTASGKEADVVVGGPPCQGFSTIGRVKIASLVREGTWKLHNAHPRFIDDPRNVLYKHFVEVVEDLQPKFFVMENVPGMKSYRNGEIVRQIRRDFESIRLGYRVLGVEVLNALWYGVPQKRKRIFFVGAKLKNANFSWPAIEHLNSGEAEKVPPNIPRSKNVKPPVSVEDAIDDLPSLEAGQGKEEMNYPPAPSRLSHYQELMRREDPKTGKPPGKLCNHVARYHNERDLMVFGSELFKEGLWWKDLPEEFRRLYGYRDDIFHDKIKRLHRERPSWTVVAHLYKDGYMYVHPTQPRTITVREAARLQSFPDWFRFEGSRTDQFKQVGNAVPPFLAKAVAGEVRKALESALG